MPDTPLDRREYFISYNSADRDFALALSEAFDAEGISHHIDRKGLQPGQSIGGWMEAAVDSYVRMVGLCSPDYFKPEAEYSAAERQAAFWADAAGREGRFVPVLIRDCEVPALYAQRLRIDVRAMTQDAAVAHVLSQLRGEDQRGEHERQRAALPHPDIFHVPRPRLPSFTGHFAQLAEVHRSLSQGDNAAVTQAFTGMGGIGKSTLAAEYAHRFGSRGRYAGVWWIDAETGVLDDLAALGRAVGLEAKPDLPQAARDAVSWLGAQDRPWLVIFDNVRNADQVRDWLPAGSARTLITSRATDYRRIAQTTRLDHWPPATTTDFLLDQTGRDDRDRAVVLAETLGGLPLAADQAAAFLRDRPGITFTAYAELLVELIDRAPDPGNEAGYPATVYATIVRSIEDDAVPEATRDLLCLCSWLSPDGVDMGLLVAVAETRPEFVPDPLGEALRDPVARADLAAPALRLSLMRSEGEGDDVTLIVHRITQTVLRRWQAQTGRIGWDGHATGLVNAAFPGRVGDNPSAWERAARLLPHALTLAEHGPRQGKAAEWLGRLLNEAGIFLHVRGDMVGALTLMEPNVDLARAAYGEQSEQYSSVLMNLSNRYVLIGRYEDAEAGYLSALQIGERMLGPTHPNIAIILNNLSRVYSDQDEFDRAEPLLRRALEIGNLPSNDGVYNVAGGLNELGALYGDWAKQPGQEHRRGRARDLHNQALATARAERGERHPDVATYLHNMAILSNQLDDPAQAANLERRAAAITVSLALIEHPDTQHYLEHLLHFLDRAGQGIAPDDLGAFLLPEILTVEMEMAEWVEQDPDTRHFGPQSFFADKPELLAQAQAAMGADD